MKKGNGNLTEQEKKQLKNDKYRSNQVQFLSDHTHNNNGEFYTITTVNGEKLITVITCKACRKSITFYYNLI